MCTSAGPRLEVLGTETRMEMSSPGRFCSHGECSNRNVIAIDDDVYLPVELIIRLFVLVLAKIRAVICIVRGQGL